jgi:hypothetical protein
VDEAEHPATTDGGIRVSDAERDAALEELGEHASVGRLTLDELEDRAGRMLAAKTRAEVQELTSDLPSEPAVPARRRRPARWLVAVLGGSQRRGRFRAAGTVNMIAPMGGDHVDFRDAEIDGGEVTVNAVSIRAAAIFTSRTRSRSRSRDSRSWAATTSGAARPGSGPAPRWCGSAPTT